MPVPDSVINSARIDGQTTSFIDPNQSGLTSEVNQSSGFTSTMMSSGMISTSNNLTELG